MERWNSQVAVVTGASSGIGAACVRALHAKGMVVVGVARRLERVQALRDELGNRVHPFKCDIRNEADVIALFADIENKIGRTYVLINNAGVARATQLISPDNGDLLREVIDTNVMGVAYCTREAFKCMKRHNIDGHVILINSVLGHQVFTINGHSANIYPPSKFAVTAMTETYRNEFRFANTKVKITSISPGLVDTEIVSNRAMLDENPHLKAEDIADAVIYCLGTPPHVQVHELTIRPLGEKL